MDRLLSEQEMLSILSFVSFSDFGKEQLGKLLVAQRAKPDKEWVEWIEKHCMVPLDEWEERKKEIGL